MILLYIFLIILSTTFIYEHTPLLNDLQAILKIDFIKPFSCFMCMNFWLTFIYTLLIYFLPIAPFDILNTINGFIISLSVGVGSYFFSIIINNILKKIMKKL